MTRIRLYHALLPGLLVFASLLLAGCGNGGGY
jgi:predicted small secreted protein